MDQHPMRFLLFAMAALLVLMMLRFCLCRC